MIKPKLNVQAKRLNNGKYALLNDVGKEPKSVSWPHLQPAAAKRVRKRKQESQKRKTPRLAVTTTTWYDLVKS
ncbi:hypothetical protein V5799_009456 [Amblyomma americanum]|uniref:Uncharacterized protein n=1 Tax=Amblyomma americanum TaxID=6943 RepID=A0AAQ4FAA4_AMBAM